MWILRSTDALKPYTIRLTPDAVRTVGRGPRANFKVDAALVSRVHCSLSASATNLTVEDLKSTNGLFVNDKRVGRSSLNIGDHLRLGRFELVLSRE